VKIQIPKDFFSPEFDRAVQTVADRLLNREWEEYLALVRRAEAHPANRPGADKSSVEQTLTNYRCHYRRAVRVP